MSLYVLDTDTLTLYRQGDPLVGPRVDAHPAQELAITVISVEEQLSGWYTVLRQARQPDRLARAYLQLAESVRYLGGWNILTFTEPAMAIYEQLKALKLNVAKSDLRIAAIILENDAILVTRNLRDFQRVPNLPVENWAV
jgi:tRNA(fMet)-specific endonuclease VapC